MTRDSILLPTGSRITPANPADGVFHQTGDVLYVTKNVSTGALRAFGSGGGHITGYDLGTFHPVRHDQTRRTLGTFTVIGIVHPDGNTQGTIPGRTIAYWVFK